MTSQPEKLRQQQKKQYEEYLQEINTQTNQEEKIQTLHKIIKSEKRTIPNLITATLEIILIIIITSAIIHGRYIAKEIQVIETCQENLINTNPDWTIPQEIITHELNHRNCWITKRNISEQCATQQ